MLRTIATYGLIAGLIVGIPLFGLTVGLQGHRETTLDAVAGYTVMLVALAFVFLAVKRRRDRELGGVIHFWQALILGLGISFVASVIYVIAWEAALAVTHMDFGAVYGQAVIAQAKAKGVSGAELSKVVADMQTFRANYANPLYRLPMTFTEIFPIGVLVSLISAVLLANRRFMPARSSVR